MQQIHAINTPGVSLNNNRYIARQIVISSRAHSSVRCHFFNSYSFTIVWFCIKTVTSYVVHCVFLDESPHVHFPADQVQAHDAEIVVQPVGDNQLDIHLGFLQVHYHYQIQLVIKDKLSEDLKIDPLQNLNVSIMEAVPTDDGKLLFYVLLCNICNIITKRGHKHLSMFIRCIQCCWLGIRKSIQTVKIE